MLAGLAGLTTAGIGTADRGCGARPGRSGGRGRVALTLLSHYGEGPLKAGLQRAVDDWNAGQSHSRVETMAVRFEDLLTTVVVRQAAGQGADIVHLYALWAGQLVRTGVLRPVPADDAALVQDGFPAAVTRAVSVDGAAYGYPTEVQTYGLYCNRASSPPRAPPNRRAPGGNWRPSPVRRGAPAPTATPWSRAWRCPARTTPRPSTRRLALLAPGRRFLNPRRAALRPRHPRRRSRLSSSSGRLVGATRAPANPGPWGCHRHVRGPFSLRTRWGRGHWRC
ncbi:hypothetical protein GCM10020221_06040 [Streptomyces thioluteus]|uniref:Extracellular solute-binding protein n=1 Tax=Streptomyces thioluteus TaxID=66431 RepID=A0ABN3WGX6_STRTU